MRDPGSMSRVIVDKVLMLGLVILIPTPIATECVLLAPDHSCIMTSPIEPEEISGDEELVVACNLGHGCWIGGEV